MEINNTENNQKPGMDLKKMNKTVLIAAGVLAVALIVSVALSALNGGKDKDATTETETGTENVVTDTTAPKVAMKQRYIFTNDIAKLSDFSFMIDVSEDSDYTCKLIRFEKKDVLSEMNELALKNLTEGTDSFVDKEAAMKVGSEEIPTQPGVYRSVLEIVDASGNISYEEVFVILDKDAAMINEAEDVVVTMSADKLSEKPEIDTSIYKGYDEVDGTLTSEDLKFELSLMDETKHEWKLTISYTDRARNYSEALYKVTVVEEKQQTAGNTGSSNNGNGGNSNNGETNNGNTNTGGTNTGNANNGSSTTKPGTNTGNANTGSTNNGGNASNGGNANSGNTGNNAGNIQEYDPADANKDGWVDANEEMGYITPQKQKCIDAGYGVVVEQDGGTWYAVLTEGPDHTYNGKTGFWILEDYLKEHGLHSESTGGCWIDPTNGWYWYTAEGISEIPESTMGDDFNFEDGEIEWH